MAFFILIKIFPQFLSTLDFLVGREKSNFLWFDCLGIILVTPSVNILNNEGLLVDKGWTTFGIFEFARKFGKLIRKRHFYTYYIFKNQKLTVFTVSIVTLTISVMFIIISICVVIIVSLVGYGIGSTIEYKEYEI